MHQQSLLSSWVFFCNTLFIGLCDHGFSGQSRCRDTTLKTDLRHYRIAALGITTSNFGTFVAKYRPSTLLVVAIPSGGQNTLDLATTWSLNQAKIHLIQRPLLGLATSTPMTEASRKTQCRLYFNAFVIVNVVKRLLDIPHLHSDPQNWHVLQCLAQGLGDDDGIKYRSGCASYWQCVWCQQQCYILIPDDPLNLVETTSHSSVLCLALLSSSPS